MCIVYPINLRLGKKQQCGHLIEWMLQALPLYIIGKRIRESNKPKMFCGYVWYFDISIAKYQNSLKWTSLNKPFFLQQIQYIIQFSLGKIFQDRLTSPPPLFEDFFLICFLGFLSFIYILNQFICICNVFRQNYV